MEKYTILREPRPLDGSKETIAFPVAVLRVGES